MEIRDLEPKSLWGNFADLNAVPRASKKEEKVIEFIISFGQALGLETRRDEIGNVVIKKPASPGMEAHQTVVLQSHLDMVHQKNNDTSFDFTTQGIDMFAEGDWVKARGTTLGADNGIGVAAIMSILASKDIVHPPLEALFTIDEETGMTGAMKLKPEMVKGRILLNLDTEDDQELSIGCAGGLDSTTEYSYKGVSPHENGRALTVKIKGLTGGHSGMDIDKGRANANKLMNRLLYKAAGIFSIQLASLDGGSLRNAIPRESTALVVIRAEELDQFKKFLAECRSVIKTEYQVTDPNLLVECDEAELPASVMGEEDFRKVLNAIYAVPNGVFRMSPDIEGLVEASSNLARVVVKDGVFSTQSLQRSSVESTKEDVATAVKAAFENIGAQVEQSGDYPGWKPNPSSPVLHLMEALYKQTFGHEPEVKACHAGLECGILGGHFPGMDMISFGPTIIGAHSPEERVQISSVQKFWGYLLNVLREIP
ncbi:aminoacyl-histidine dipeptidase [Arcticibacter sp. MXS-1]|uniref:aminoacyl-histidine dipeptidase n=1 Tax=Arcticibacter sp. MXS-1 TaxID=3341726 RepID=UPI0035A8582A